MVLRPADHPGRRTGRTLHDCTCGHLPGTRQVLGTETMGGGCSSRNYQGRWLHLLLTLASATCTNYSAVPNTLGRSGDTGPCKSTNVVLFSFVVRQERAMSRQSHPSLTSVISIERKSGRRRVERFPSAGQPTPSSLPTTYPLPTTHFYLPTATTFTNVSLRTLAKYGEG